MSTVEIELLLEAAKVNLDLAQIKDLNEQADAKLHMTRDDAKVIIGEIEQRITETEKEVAKRVHTIFGMITEADKASLHALQRSLGVIKAIYGLIKQALNAAGVSLPPILSALISTAFQVATTLLSLAQANMSNPYTIALGIMALIGAGISLAAAIDAETKSQAIQSQLSSAQSGPSFSETGYEAVII